MPTSHRGLVVSLLAAAALAQQPYGDPTPGSGGYLPRLAAPGPWLGNPGFGFQLVGGAGGAPAWVLLGVGPGSTQLFGFELLLDPAGYQGSILTLLSGAQPGQGQGFAPLPLGAALAPTLLGAAFRAQAVVADAGAPGGAFAATQGLRFELGLPPLVFVGCSIAAGDPFQLVDPSSNAIVDSGAPAQVDNTTAAVFARGGQRLFVASSIRGTIGMADVTTLPASWSTVFSGGGSCYGLAYDPRRDWLWTLTDPGSGSRELCAIDIDERSPGFGSIAANTTGVATGLYERWDLSPSGRRIAVLGLLPGTLTIVDADETSPTFLQNLVNAAQIPVNQQGAISIANQVRITPDDRYALILIQLAGATPAELARYDLAAGAFVDHDPSTPAVDNLGPQSQPPVLFGGAPHGFSLAQSGTFAVLSGFNGCGWIGRLDLDPYDPLAFAWTPWSPAAPVQQAWAAALSADETEVAVTSWQSGQCTTPTSPTLVRLDAASGALLGAVPLPQNSNSANLQNLYTVVYR